MRDRSSAGAPSTEAASLPQLDMRLSMRPTLIRELVMAHPKGRIKAVEFNAMGGLFRVEWYDDGTNQPARAEAGS